MLATQKDKMLEYFAYKKVKQHRAEKAALASQPNSGRDSGRNSGEKEERGSRTPKPVLTPEDEAFLRRLAEEGAPPQLPERPVVFSDKAGSLRGNDAQLTHTRDFGEEPEHQHSHSHSQSHAHSHSRPHESHESKEKGKENADDDGDKRTPSKSGGKFTNKVAALFGKSTKVTKQGLHADHPVPPAEAEKEEDDIAKVLNDLNMSAVNNRAFSLSRESQELVQKFTLVLKDIVNGAPHAYDDLVNLLEDGQGTLAKSYESMPGFMQKLVTTLPEKLTSQLAPELLAVATEAQGLNKDGSISVGTASAGGGLTGAAKSFLKPSSLKDLVTKPGAVAGMLKTIMNSLKLRWPAFMGTNVLLSLGLFVLMFVFWYCHKRGREVRLGKDGKMEVVDSEGRIVELNDDAMLTDRPSGERRDRYDRHCISDGGGGSSSSNRRHEHRGSDGSNGSHGSHRSRHSHRSRRSHRTSDERRDERDVYREDRHGSNGSRSAGYKPEEVGDGGVATGRHAYMPQQRNNTQERLDGLVQDVGDMRVNGLAQQSRDERVYEQVVQEDRMAGRREERDYDRHGKLY